MARHSRKDDFSQKPLFRDIRPPKEVFRHLRNYLAGQVIGATRDDALLDELLKGLFCKLYLEQKRAGADIDHAADSLEAAQLYRSVFRRVREDFPEIYGTDDEILLNPENFRHVMSALGFSLLDAASDPIGDAFETFAGSESRARSGQFFTPRNVTDFLVRALSPSVEESIIDPACGAGGFLASVVRYWRSNGAEEQVIAQSTANIHGIEKDSYLAKLAKLHVALLSGGHPTIVCGDSLALCDDAGRKISERVPVVGYDVLLTNPPFGVKIVAASPKVVEQFDLARKWQTNGDGLWAATGEIRGNTPPQVLFIERCLSMLKDGGRMGIVLPESVLSNKSYRHVMQYLREKARVHAVVGMPESLFKTSGKGGTHTKTCLVIAVKGGCDGNSKHRIFMAEARWCGKDSRAREIPNDDMPEIAIRYETFKRSKPLKASPLGFAISEKDICDNVLCPRYYDPEFEVQKRQLLKTHDLLPFGQLLDEQCVSMITGDEVGKLAYGGGDIPFIRTSDISNWEIKVDPKHCIDRELYESLRRKQDVQPYDILMVKDGTYLIGTCGIVTEYDREIVFQSHLYKIRVNDNPHGLNPFLLLAILASRFVQRQIRAKQFTQDIIDSLGERIRELLLPVPKASELREKITGMVKCAVTERIEARELARRATMEVASIAD